MLHHLWLRVLRKIGRLKHIHTSTTLKLNQQKFIIPIHKEVGMHNLMMDEFWMLDLFKKMSFKEDYLLIDIGANVGQSFLKWKSVYPNSRYMGVEPIPACVKYLRELIQVNRLSKSVIIETAISDKSEPRKLAIHFDEASDRSASLVSHEFEAIKHLEIQSISFKDLIKQYRIPVKEIACIKIDVEGAELEILRSSLATFEQSNAIIIIEILGQPKDKISEINDLISASNYNLYSIKKRALHLESIQAIDEIIPGLPIEESDYLLINKNDKVMQQKLNS